LSKTLVLRSNITKSFLKGAILITLFSLFLEINPSTYVNYLIFLAVSFGAIGVYMYTKRSNAYTISEDGIVIGRLMKEPLEIQYQNISGMTISQGRLAKAFHCGTVYIELKEGKGAYRTWGGRPVQVLKDVPDPEGVYNLVADRLGPF